MIFVDTGVWFAAYVVEDVGFPTASALISQPSDRLVTTDDVIDELLTLLVAREHKDIAHAIGRQLLAEQLCEIVWVDRADARAAWEVFETHVDKRWSFTDCESYAVMKRLAIKAAFAIDKHFSQFGFAVVRP